MKRVNIDRACAGITLFRQFPHEEELDMLMGKEKQKERQREAARRKPRGVDQQGEERQQLLRMKERGEAAECLTRMQ